MYYGLQIIQGRLAELIGDVPRVRRRETAVHHDRKMRTFGFYRAARRVAANLDAETRGLLQAYCEGVNDYVAAHRGKLHPLFRELGLEPEPWTPADCISGKTFNARGVGVPGSPGMLIGWTEHVAWGVTALGADQADLFRLKTDPGRPNQYWLDGKWRAMRIVRETIRVKDARPVEIVVRETHFGPVVTQFAFARRGDPQVALKRVPVCETDRETIQALMGMVRARDVHDFAGALRHWRFPSVNMVFGDSKGGIGYWLLHPVRPASRRGFPHEPAAHGAFRARRQP